MKINAEKKLVVKYNNRVVGYLAETINKDIAFQYDSDWISNGFSISPFSLKLSNDIYINKKLTFDGLYGVFWDCMPDGWGQLLVARMLKEHGVNYEKLTPIQKLSIINKNGLGALEFEPNQHLGQELIGQYDYDYLATEAEKIFNDETDGVDLDTIYNLGGSSGGARPKAHIKINNEEWIIKFPCAIDPKNIGEKEYVANELAKKCGINVSEFKLFESNRCSGYFGTKRFDRNGNKKIHMISLAAILETTHRIPNLDYGHLFNVIETICGKNEDMYEAYRRMCFNVLYKNKDDHSKNFSFLYNEEKHSYELSPAYDLTSLPNKAEHEMTVNGNGNPTESDLIQLAEDFELDINKCKDIIDTTKHILLNK